MIRIDQRRKPWPGAIPCIVTMLVLLLGLVSQARGDQAPGGCRGGPIETGQTISDRFFDEPCDYFFEARQGDRVTIALTGSSPGLDPQLRLIDPAGEEEAFDDDSGGNGNSLIRGHALLRTGKYTIRAESYGAREGQYTISLEYQEAAQSAPEDEEVAQAAAECGGAIESGREVTVRRGEICEYHFAGEEGDVVTITLSAAFPGIFPKFLLRDKLWLLASDDHREAAGGIGYNRSRIEGHRLRRTGTYTIHVELVELGKADETSGEKKSAQRGRYTLTLEYVAREEVEPEAY